MKIAIAGKGGSGKTTIAGILTRLLAERGQDVWAIDADSNPNFGVTLGLPLEKVKENVGYDADANGKVGPKQSQATYDEIQTNVEFSGDLFKAPR